MATSDPYEVLGLSRDADDKAIKEAYRRLARKHHPDVNPGDKNAEERFKDIQGAYELLSDAQKRERWDRFGAAAFAPGGGAAAHGSPFAAAGAHGFPSFDDIFGAGSLNDIIASLFGGAGRGRAGTHPPATGEDLQAALEVSFDEAFRGAEKQLQLRRPVACTACHATGVVAAGSARKPAPCPSCAGRGVEDRTESVRIRIPRGVADGATLRIPAKGAIGPGGSGDLYLTVHVRSDPRFEMDGRDLRVDLPISLAEAALGGEVPVATPDGEVTVRVPAGTPSGRRIRLAGKGFVAPNGSRSDLYAMVRIVPPPQLTEPERRLLEELASVSHFNPREPGTPSAPPA